MNFEEKWDNDGFLSSCSRADAEYFYKAGLQSRQEEVLKLQAEINELQNRINGALEAFEDGSFNYCQQILNGGKNEK